MLQDRLQFPGNAGIQIFAKYLELSYAYCVRPKAKDLGITRVVVVLVGFFI